MNKAVPEIAPIITLIVSFVTGLTAIAVAGLTYWFAKKREREAELRKEKLDHYKEFVGSLSGILKNCSTPDGKRAFARSCNNLLLIAPQSVIKALQRYQDETSDSNTKKSDDRHDQLLTNLLMEMRRDLRITASDDTFDFRARLWAPSDDSKHL